MTYKCYIMVELAFWKELILINEIHQKSSIFLTIGIFQLYIFCNCISAMGVIMYYDIIMYYDVFET